MWLVWPAPKLNSSKILLLSSLPASLIRFDKKWNCYHPDIFRSLWSAQGRVTLMPIVKSGPKSNLSEILWLSSLLASLMRILSKIKSLLPGQHFPYYTSMGHFGCHGHQRSNETCPITWYSQSPTPIMVPVKFDQDWPSGLGDILVWKSGCTDTQTDDWALLYYKLTLWAFGHLSQRIIRWANNTIIDQISR